MDFITFAIGCFALLFGLYSIYARIKQPEMLGKLDAMKARWGNQAGVTLHVISYTVVSIGVGVAFIFLGLQGVSLF